MPYDGANYPKDETARIYLKAAQIISNNGLAKGERQSRDGSVCLGGALAIAANLDIWCVMPDNLSNPIVEYLGAPNWCVAVLWNNAPERTQEEVIEALEGAAAQIEAKVK